MAYVNPLEERVKKPTSALAGSTSPNLGITKAVAQQTVAKPAVTTVNRTAQTVNTAIAQPSVDLSSYNRAWEQAQAQYNLQASQTGQSYELSQRQLAEQEGETKQQTERLAQQAYVARMQSERVLPNVMGAMGATDTGYENVARENIQATYKNRYDEYMNDLSLALASIKRAREAQTLGYNQSIESINLNRSQAESDYNYNVQQAQQRAIEAQQRALIAEQNKNAKTAQQQAEVKASAGNFEKVVQGALKYGSAERSADYLISAQKAGLISKDDANRIYNEYGQYWAYYNQ
jgi:hypothetical protein